MKNPTVSSHISAVKGFVKAQPKLMICCSFIGTTATKPESKKGCANCTSFERFDVMEKSLTTASKFWKAKE